MYNSRYNRQIYEHVQVADAIVAGGDTRYLSFVREKTGIPFEKFSMRNFVESYGVYRGGFNLRRSHTMYHFEVGGTIYECPEEILRKHNPNLADSIPLPVYMTARLVRLENLGYSGVEDDLVLRGGGFAELFGGKISKLIAEGTPIKEIDFNQSLDRKHRNIEDDYMKTKASKGEENG